MPGGGNQSSVRVLLLSLLFLGCKAPPSAQPRTQAAKAEEAAKAAKAAKSFHPSVAQILDAGLRKHVDRARFEAAPLYRIELELNERLHTYRGTQRLSWRNPSSKPVQALHFLLYPNDKALTEAGGRNLDVRRARVGGAEGVASGAGPAEVQFTVAGDHLEVRLASPLAPGASLEVELDFEGVIYRLPTLLEATEHETLAELVRMAVGQLEPKGGYGVFSVGEGIVSMALWHPVLVALTEEGWDLEAPGKVGDISHFPVANYAVEVKGLEANTQVATTGVRLEGHRYVAAAVREFTLQLSKRYESMEARVGDVRVRSWFRDESAVVGERALRYARRALKIFERLYGPYPYPELELAEAPLRGGAAGVEFPGLVTLGHVFYRDKGPLDFANHPYTKDTFEFVVAHEVAHQWWAAVVGSNSKRHPFVDEALANHAAIRYFEEAHGAQAAERQRDLQLRLAWQLARMSGAKDRPVDLRTKDFDSMMEYAATVYAKGGLFFDALRAQIGPAAFDAGLRSYYSKQAFEVAEPSQLLEALTRDAKDPAGARALADRWLKQRHGDEDIGQVDFGAMLALLLDERSLAQLGIDPRLLKSPGVKALGDLVRDVVEGRPIQADAGAILQLASELLAGEDEALGKALRLFQEKIAAQGGRLDLKTAPRALLDVGREVAGEDREARLMLDAAELLLRYAEEDHAP